MLVNFAGSDWRNVSSLIDVVGLLENSVAESLQNADAGDTATLSTACAIVTHIAIFSGSASTPKEAEDRLVTSGCVPALVRVSLQQFVAKVGQSSPTNSTTAAAPSAGTTRVSNPVFRALIWCCVGSHQAACFVSRVPQLATPVDALLKVAAGSPSQRGSDGMLWALLVAVVAHMHCLVHADRLHAKQNSTVAATVPVDAMLGVLRAVVADAVQLPQDGVEMSQAQGNTLQV